MPFDPNQPFEVVGGAKQAPQGLGRVGAGKTDQTVADYLLNDSWPAKIVHGVVGAAKRGATLPGDVYAGRSDPMSEESIGRAADLASLTLPVNPGVRAGDMALPGVAKTLRPAKVEPPTVEALKAASNQGYDRVRDMGVEYSSDAVRAAADTIRRTLEQDGILGELAPKTHAVLGKLTDPPDGSIATSSGIEAARRAFGNAGKDFLNPTDQEAARRAVEGLDEFVQAPPEGSVLAGPASAAGRALEDARGNYAAAKRSEKLAGEDNFSSIEGRAGLNAKVANSGQNLDNAVRQRVRDLLVSPKQRAGFSEEELAALQGVAEGNIPRNLTRGVGNILGGGGGLGTVAASTAAGGAGLASGSPALAAAGAMVPIIGYGAKKVANAMTGRALHGADELVRQRSPLFRQMQEAAPMEPGNPEKIAALVRALMAGQSQ